MGRFPTICTGLALCGLSCILLGPLPWLPLPPEGHASMWASMGLLGIGSAFAFTPITPAVLEAATAKVRNSDFGKHLVSASWSAESHIPLSTPAGSCGHRVVNPTPAPGQF